MLHGVGDMNMTQGRWEHRDRLRVGNTSRVNGFGRCRFNKAIEACVVVSDAVGARPRLELASQEHQKCSHRSPFGMKHAIPVKRLAAAKVGAVDVCPGALDHLSTEAQSESDGKMHSRLASKDAKIRSLPISTLTAHCIRTALLHSLSLAPILPARLGSHFFPADSLWPSNSAVANFDGGNPAQLDDLFSFKTS